jgi:hypothetical protein
VVGGCAESCRASVKAPRRSSWVIVPDLINTVRVNPATYEKLFALAAVTDVTVKINVLVQDTRLDNHEPHWSTASFADLTSDSGGRSRRRRGGMDARHNSTSLLYDCLPKVNLLACQRVPLAEAAAST